MRLTPQEQAVLRAVVDRILPADDYPGAWDAGASEYLGRQLDGDLLAMREVVQAGLAALDAEAQTRSGAGFAALSPEAQDALLRDVESGAVRAEWTVSPQHFFALLVRTTAEGFYSDPAQGGNRNRVSWAMTGFERDPA
jgi:gluconate 2-dehydrogenase subunit 3-like protein